MKTLFEQYGPVALVTGASSGMGEQFCRVLAQQGFDLLIVARREDKLKQLAQELQLNHNVNVTCLVCDLSDSTAIETLIEQALQQDLGLIVSNAGFGAKGEFLEHDDAQVEAMYQTNSITPSKLAYRLLPQLVKKGRGGIIFTGSIEGEVAFPYSTPYAASKAFMNSFARSLWLEMKPHNIDVLLLAPGSTDTEAPYKQGMTRDQLIGLVSPEHVAQKALKCLGKKMCVTPGITNHLFITFLKILPRKWSTVIAGLGMKKAIQDAKATLNNMN